MSRDVGVLSYPEGGVVSFTLDATLPGGDAYDGDASSVKAVIALTRSGDPIATADSVEAVEGVPGRFLIGFSDVSALSLGTAYPFVVWTGHGTNSSVVQVHGKILITEEIQPGA